VTATRVGLFGGTFNPPHFGHVAALRAAAATGLFDSIEVTVAGDPYLKHDLEGLRPAAQRLAMANAAFADLDLVHVSDREIRRQGPSYTVDTVRELLRDTDAVDVLIGADLVAQLPRWHSADELARLVRVGVFPRPGDEVTIPTGWDGYEIPMAPVDLSSSFLRAASLDAEHLRAFVPAEVIELLMDFAE